jgi:uncharacterized protein YndB with AHSA1/START domain
MANDTAAARQHQVEISRVFAVPVGQVFAAWTSAEHVKRWFCPHGFSVPQAQVEARVGGAFEVCMRAPDGTEHWTRGRFVEVVANARLVIDMAVPGADGQPLFTAHTVVGFAEECGGTRVDVVQSYTVFDPAALQMIQGARQGWTETLDRLGHALPSVAPPAAARSVVHGSFRIERRYGAPRERVFRAFTDPQAKASWFAGGSAQQILVREMDVRPGGRERVRGRWESGMVSTFEAVYFDVVPNERIVYTYEMHLDERKISVSLATIELREDGAGTLLVLNEHGAFLDGYDDAGSRERGTSALMDALGASLRD